MIPSLLIALVLMDAPPQIARWQDRDGNTIQCFTDTKREPATQYSVNGRVIAVNVDCGLLMRDGFE